MEKRNVIEEARTPDFPKQADADQFDKEATAMFNTATVINGSKYTVGVDWGTKPVTTQAG